MKWNSAYVGAWCLVASPLLFGQAGGEVPKATETTAPDIPGVVAGGTKVQVIQTWNVDFAGEGPIGMPDGSLLFSQQLVNKIIKIDESGTFSTYLDTAPNQVIGLAYDLKGRLISASRGQPAGLLALAPRRAVLADKFEGQPFEGPNDLVVDAKGGVYLTDNAPSNMAGIYYMKPDGRVLRVTQLLHRPNGVQLSPDGKVLYACSGFEEFVKAFDVQPDGRLSNPRNFGRLGKPQNGGDGMAVDAVGRLYVSMNEGVMVFSPHGGKPLGVIPTSIRPRNVAFAGPDRKTLYIITRGVAYKVAMLAEGVKGRAK